LISIVQVERGAAKDWARSNEPTVLTIGNFDGVHVGHAELVGGARRAANEHHAQLALLTFDPHPRCVLDLENCPRLITTVEERLKIFAGIGVDRALVWPFTREVSEISADDFCEMLASNLNLKALVVGKDFALGRRRQGDVEFLNEWFAPRECEIRVVELVGDGEVVSSSRIRELITAGAVGDVSPLLGRDYFIDGPVIGGEKLGTTLGFPTANIAIGPHKLLPQDGVYCGWLRIGDEWHPTAISVGMRPTFGGQDVVVEAFVLDFDGDLYGQNVRCAFVQRLREQRTYASVEPLIAQIAADVQESREILSRRSPPQISKPSG
jgi:riboflavin kinase/FMN adenylyltransferase